MTYKVLRMNIDSEKYLAIIKAKAQEDKGTLSEWNQIVGEITDFLNEERNKSNKLEGTKYPQIDSKRVAMLVSYIKQKGGYGDLRKFRDDVRSKGAWFFWWVVKPKRDPSGNIR